MKKLAQLKIDTRNNGWPWPIDHPNDERALFEGCWLDFNAAERVREFYADLLRIPKDGGGTQPFILLEWWYRDVIAPLFGWKRADGRRRYNKGFITTGKKSAKSTVLSGLPIYMITADGVEQAEAYSAATTRDQAGIIYEKISRMVKDSTALSSILKRVDSKKRLVHGKTGSWFQALASEAGPVEGKNPHLLIADELHVWKDRKFFTSLMYGNIQRTQPLFLMITTAGDARECIGFEEYEFAKDLLDRNNSFYSMSHFAFIAEASKDREWDNPIGWKEANPSLDLPEMPLTETLLVKCKEAKQSPRKKRDFIRYICNRWVDASDEPWIGTDLWNTCNATIPDHAGESCCGGLDLSQTEDLTSLALAFNAGGFIDVLWWFWTPAATLKAHEDAWRVPLRDWVDAGIVTATPGCDIDYSYVRKVISGVMLDADGNASGEQWDDCAALKYNVESIDYDPWNARSIVDQLGKHDGVNMVEHPQGYGKMSAPSKDFRKLVNDGKLRHGGNPVLEWMAGHCEVAEDHAGNIIPSRSKSRHKIDGIVTGIMAAWRAVQLDVGTAYTKTTGWSKL